jgi:hypothetical protein
MLCEHANNCGRNESSYCGSGCGGLRERDLNAAAQDALAKCLTQSCSAMRDQCLAEVASAQPTRDEDRAFRSKCAASACSLDQSTCGSTNKTELLLADRVANLSACLDRGCASTADTLAVRNCIFALLPPGG